MPTYLLPAKTIEDTESEPSALDSTVASSTQASRKAFIMPTYLLPAKTIEDASVRDICSRLMRILLMLLPPRTMPAHRLPEGRWAIDGLSMVSVFSLPRCRSFICYTDSEYGDIYRMSLKSLSKIYRDSSPRHLLSLLLMLQSATIDSSPSPSGEAVGNRWFFNPTKSQPTLLTMVYLH